jgi:N-acetylmuramoyl-L-alanine amidase
VFKPAGIIFLGALMLLAGCATTPSGPEEPVSSPAPDQAATSLNWVDPKAAPPSRPPPLPRTNRPAATNIIRPTTAIPKPAPVATTTWSSLSRWAVEHRLAAPRFISNVPVTTYSISSGNGQMILTLGSRAAMWNGVEIMLGFEPQLIDGQIFLHALDLKKNLEPLLCAPPLTFGTNRVIMIDPGHGGSNVGTHSVVDGRFEKEFTLDWAKRLKPLLETNGWTVFLTRTSDSFVTNTDRAVLAGARHADLFISLHFNSGAPDQRQSGLETYCLTPTGMASTLTRNYTDFWTDHFPNNDYDAENLQLAVQLHRALLHATGEEDRGVRRARFMDVLRSQHCPAILIEGGFLSNPQEAKRVADPEFRQQLAEAVANALKQSEDGEEMMEKR